MKTAPDRATQVRTIFSFASGTLTTPSDKAVGLLQEFQHAF
jgi:hypothetical protein